jgi:hypothetical protein
MVQIQHQEPLIWGSLLSPNMEYLKLWVCIRAVTLHCLTMAELICIEFKYFLEISFLSELGIRGTRKNGIYPKKPQYLLKYWFSNSYWRKRCRFWTSAHETNIWLKRYTNSAEQTRFSDVKQMFLINLLWQLQLLPQYFMINQKHPLKTYRHLCQVEQFLLQILVHCLQVQIKS